jgi:hypothetical protein
VYDIDQPIEGAHKLEVKLAFPTIADRMEYVVVGMRCLKLRVVVGMRCLKFAGFFGMRCVGFQCSSVVAQMDTYIEIERICI